MLWLLGMLSFILRGGIILLLLPIIVLPTQVEVRLMLGTNLGTGGFAPAFWVAVAVAAVVSTGLVMVVLYVLARIEVAAFDRLAGDTETAADAGLAWDPAARLRDLFVVESLTLVVLLLAAVPLAAALGQSAYDEILRPSSTADIYDRVLGHLAVPLAIVAIALPIVDSISAMVVRWLLSGRSVGQALRSSVGAIVRHPLSILATAALAWLFLITAVVGIDVALTVAWQQTRAAFLATTSVRDMLSEVAPLLVAVMLAAVFVCGLALAGYVAGFRNALWSVTTRRR